MRLFLLSIIVGLCLAASTGLDEQVEQKLKATADSVIANNLNDARTSAVSGLRRIRRVARDLREKRRQCGSVSCVTDINKQLKVLRKSRREFRQLENCAGKYRKDAGKREKCVRKVVAKADASKVKTAAKTADAGKADTVKKVVEKAVGAAQNNVMVQETGEAAIVAFKARLELLKKRKVDCAKLRFSERRSCRKQVRRERRQVRREAKLLSRIEKCVKRHPSNEVARRNCIKDSRKQLLNLLEKKGITKKEEKKVEKKVEQKKVEPKKEVRKEDKALLDLVRKAIKSASDKSGDAIRDGEAAIKALRERVQKAEQAIKACKKLKGDARKQCKKGLQKEIRRNRRERRLLRQLEGCAARFREDRDRRTNCVARVVRVLMQMLDPISSADAPNDLQSLESREDVFRSGLVTQLREMRNKLSQCRSRRCRRLTKRAIKNIRKQIRGVEKGFAPRRVCLMRRRTLRQREFRVRATEHLTLYELHTEASRCETLRCVRTFSKSQKQLEKTIRKARSSRKAKWNKLRCPLVSAKMPEITTLTYKVETKKPTKKERQRDPRIRRLAQLHYRMHKLYERMDKCDDRQCKVRVRKEVRRIRRVLKNMDRRRRKRLQRARRRHLRRARLHRKLNKIYTRAAACRNSKCRKATRKQLRKYRRALKKINRSFLGSKRAGRRVNRYIRMLRNELQECGIGKDAKKCRRAVFKRFRRQTEKRDRAVLQELRRIAKRKVVREVRKCMKLPKKSDQDSCVKKVQKWETKRLAELQLRLIELERRRAIRMCESTSNSDVCAKAVQKEFKADKKRAKKEASKVAKSDVKKAVAQQPSTRSAVGAAGSLTISLALVLAALIFAAIF